MSSDIQPASTSQTDAENHWEAYYQARQGRAPRPLFLEILARVESEPGWEPARRLAIDLGCGDGTETGVLLAHGWRVLAVDGQPAALRYARGRATPEQADRLETACLPFEELALPAADLVYSGFSLPYCPPASFGRMWQAILQAVQPGGFFGGNLFGDHDGYAGDPDASFFSLAQARALFPPAFQLVLFREVEEDGQSFSGPKHWHLIEFLAERTSTP